MNSINYKALAAVMLKFYSNSLIDVTRKISKYFSLKVLKLTL